MQEHFLPNPSDAVVDPAKVRDYLLSRDHPVGRFKAVVFEAAGYRSSAWRILRADLLQSAWLRVRSSEPTEFGQRYLVDTILRGPAGQNLAVRVVWLVRVGDNYPRLITVIPRGRR